LFHRVKYIPNPQQKNSNYSYSLETVDTWQREVAKALHASKSLINKVLRRQSAGERGPRKHGTGVRRCFSPITIKYMVELLSHEGKGKSNTMRDVQRILKEELGQYWPGG